MVPDCLLQDRQRSLANLVLLQSTQLSLIELGFWDVNVLTVDKREQD